MRNNSGGIAADALQLVDCLTRHREDYESLYVIIDPYTVSYGAVLADTLATLNDTILIGEPTGQGTSDLGGVASFELPNSGLKCNYSTSLYAGLFFHTTEIDDFPHLNYDDTSVLPDIFIENTIDDYRNQQDRVLNYILADK